MIQKSSGNPMVITGFGVLPGLMLRIRVRCNINQRVDLTTLLPRIGTLPRIRAGLRSRRGRDTGHLKKRNCILRHLGLWQEGVRVHCGIDPPGETTLDPWLDDPFPDYDTEPVMAFSAT